MKALVVDGYGSPARLGDVPEPQLSDHDVLVRVRAAGVNALDAKIRDGEFKRILPYRMPIILGNDVAGVVVAVGPEVQQFKPGDEVYARPDKDRIGAFAELIAVHQDDLAIKPAGLSMEQAASLPLVALTAWQALVEKAHLGPGQRLFIQAGSGGVGTVAIQLAKHLGATVATTTSTANVDWVKSLGADLVIDYTKDDFATLLRGYDVVLDSRGGKTLEQSLHILRPGGTVIGIAGPPDPDFATEIGASRFLRLAMTALSYRTRRLARRLHVNYSFLFMRASGHQLRQITALIDAGAIHPVIDRVFPFDASNQALAYVEQGRAKGKVVVSVS